MNIISDNDFDEDAARDFLMASYDGVDLLPGMPEELTENLAAIILKVSEPTIKRMVQERQIVLKKSAILTYIKQKMMVNRPLNLEK
ncbi:MAG: hypothetical protein IKS40_09575 [Treponema sp.]|nr:hypothetical protein [Treponema sp.]